MDRDLMVRSILLEDVKWYAGGREQRQSLKTATIRLAARVSRLHCRCNAEIPTLAKAV